MSIIEKAQVFATAAHAAVGQRRKYTDEPYIVHPTAVVDILTTQTAEPTPAMLAAAWLHDVVEDTKVDVETLRQIFGREIAFMVWMLTDPPNIVGNRAARKAEIRTRLADATSTVQTIKLADLIDNTKTIVRYDPAFARVYLEEKRALLEVLTRGDPALHEIARQQCEQRED